MPTIRSRTFLYTGCAPVLKHYSSMMNKVLIMNKTVYM